VGNITNKTHANQSNSPNEHLFVLVVLPLGAFPLRGVAPPRLRDRPLRPFGDLLPPLCKHMAGDTTCKSTQGSSGFYLLTDRNYSELFCALRSACQLNTQTTIKHFRCGQHYQQNTCQPKQQPERTPSFFCCVAPRGISFAGRSPTPPLRSPIAALRGWPARTREYAGLCLPVGGSRGLMMAALPKHYRW
jgi:hypothetical protein